MQKALLKKYFMIGIVFYRIGFEVNSFSDLIYPAEYVEKTEKYTIRNRGQQPFWLIVEINIESTI